MCRLKISDLGAEVRLLRQETDDRCSGCVRWSGARFERLVIALPRDDARALSGMTEKALQQIVAEAGQRWQQLLGTLRHRIGPGCSQPTRS